MSQFSPVHWLIVALMVAPLLALMIVPAWRILQRAGFSGAWSLLMLVPLVGFVVLWVLAFVKWPNDSEGNTRTSLSWIVAGFVMLPLSIGALVLMSSTGVRQVATVEQRTQAATSKAEPRATEDGPWKMYESQKSTADGEWTQASPNLKPFDGKLDGER